AAGQCVGNTPGFVRIGGTVSGLADAGLVLRDNGADDLLVTAPGAFRFATLVHTGDPYAVTIAAQPSSQNCSVANGAGTAGTIDVTDVTVTCTSDPGILCGTSYCDPTSQVCCVTSGTPACSATCNGPNTVKIDCDDHQDCVARGQPQLVCCGATAGGNV